ncbi:MAG TPA: hypothetical protein PK431_07015 [Chitinophagales bacterium]|nr:hypothetical protein [Chitinophagales bacterium]
MKKEKTKYHAKLLEVIKDFKKPKWSKLISKDEAFNNVRAYFKPYKKTFKLNFSCNTSVKRKNLLDVGQYHKGIQIQFGRSIYNLERIHLDNHAPPAKFTASTSNISTKGFSEKQKYYYQLVIPLDSELEFEYNIEQTTFSTDLGFYSRCATDATIKGELFKACCINDKKGKKFLVIDSESKQAFDAFAQKAYAIKVGIGYLSGYYIGNQGFFFAYTSKNKKDHKHFKCVGLRDSIKSSYDPVYSNAYGYLHYNKPLAKKYQPLLRPVSLTEFSNLCEKIYDLSDFASLIMLMLESSIASLLFMPGGYAIALETISDLIIGSKKLNLAPIKSKAISRNIRKEFLRILDKYSTSISSEDLDILYKRIDQFNQTTNKSRLRAPFDLLGINLLPEDLKILETRNDFLHGRIPDITNAGVNRSTERINKDLFYSSIRFYVLINMLILKWIGYDNRVVNYPKIHEGFTEIPLDEEPFRQV